MTTKPHYRLRRLIDCPDGTRFYTKTTHNPYTLVTKSPKRAKIWVHKGLTYNLAGRFVWSASAQGWVEV